MTYHTSECRIIMADGSTKNSNNVQVGDLIMGPDSKSRTVVNIKQSTNINYKLETKNNQVIYLSSDSQLFLTRTKIGTSKYKLNEEKKHSLQLKINIDEYLNNTNYFKHMYKIKLQNINLTKNHIELDPYFLGLLLGDGSLGDTVCLHTENKEIESEIYKQAKKYNLSIRIHRDKTKQDKKFASYYFFGNGKKNNNKLRNIINDLNLLGTNCDSKFVPQYYLSNTMDIRKKVIAGLIDTDGSKAANCCYDWISKSKQLADDMTFLCRSIGFRVTFTETIKSCQTGASGLYYRLYISGDIDKLPIKINYKQSTKRMQKKNHQMMGFSIIKLTDNKTYYSFTVDQDGMYLDENFIPLCGI